MVQVVTWLAAEGLTTVGLLAAVDHNALVNLGLSNTDADRVILSAWLHARGFEMYGARLVQRGIVSKLRCPRAHRHPAPLGRAAATAHVAFHRLYTARQAPCPLGRHAKGVRHQADRPPATAAKASARRRGAAGGGGGGAGGGG